MEETIKKAKHTLECVLEAIEKRVQSISGFEEEETEHSIKLIKNEELIKFAKFILELLDREEEKNSAKETQEDKNGEVKIVLDGEVEGWAK